MITIRFAERILRHERVSRYAAQTPEHTRPRDRLADDVDERSAKRYRLSIRPEHLLERCMNGATVMTTTPPFDVGSPYWQVGLGDENLAPGPLGGQVVYFDDVAFR